MITLQKQRIVVKKMVIRVIKMVVGGAWCCRSSRLDDVDQEYGGGVEWWPAVALWWPDFIGRLGLVKWGR